MTNNTEEVEKGLKEVEQAMDLLREEAQQDRITYRSNPTEGLRRAERRTSFLEEIHMIAKDDTLTATQQVDSYRRILVKYGLRSN